MSIAIGCERWMWSALSLLSGAVMGAMVAESPSMLMPSIGRHFKGTSVKSDRTSIAPSQSGLLTVSDSPPTTDWPAVVTRQMADPHYLAHSRRIWLPAEFVERYRWNPGTITGGCKLSPDAKSIMDVDEAEAVRVEQAIDRFVNGIREIESRHAVFLEKTLTTVNVRVPAGLTPNGPKQQLEAELLPIVGPVVIRSLYARIKASLENISPVMSGKQFEIRSTLLNGDRIETSILREGGGSSSWHVFPEQYAHLLPAIVGPRETQRWE